MSRTTFAMNQNMVELRQEIKRQPPRLCVAAQYGVALEWQKSMITTTNEDEVKQQGSHAEALLISQDQRAFALCRAEDNSH